MLPVRSYFSSSSENCMNITRMSSLRCPKRPCKQETLENYMSRVMKLISGTDRIHTVFENHEIIEIIHGCLTAFADEPTLLQFPLPENGLVIIGDLHGDAFCLLKALEFYGFPPDVTYLFLGDFLDRGPMQNEVLLFILLMKLRWPEYVYLLRGNHELYDLMKHDFKNQCLMDYDDPAIFVYINQLFDYFPLAAIVSDYFFFCHAGVSQWMTCRANIANIPRPTDLSNMKILEGCIVTDMLWSDPKPNQKVPFDLSERGCCYSFNQEALHAVLRALNVHILIRGHQVIPEGILDNFGDGSCITVHTATRESIGCNASGTLKILRKDDGKFVMEKRIAKIKCKEAIADLRDTVHALLRKSFQGNGLNRITQKCRWCRKAFPRNVTHIRNSGLAEIAFWVSRYALRYAQRDEIFHEAWRKRYDRVIVLRAYQLFPVLYDAVAFEGGTSTMPATYRVILAEWEKAFLFNLFGTASDFELTETLANDVDPGLLEIQRHRSKPPNFLERTSRRVRNMLRHVVGLRDLPSFDDTDVRRILPRSQLID